MILASQGFHRIGIKWLQCQIGVRYILFLINIEADTVKNQFENLLYFAKCMNWIYIMCIYFAYQYRYLYMYLILGTKYQHWVQSDSSWNLCVDPYTASFSRNIYKNRGKEVEEDCWRVTILTSVTFWLVGQQQQTAGEPEHKERGRDQQHLPNWFAKQIFCFNQV